MQNVRGYGAEGRIIKDPVHFTTELEATWLGGSQLYQLAFFVHLFIFLLYCLDIL